MIWFHFWLLAFSQDSLYYSILWLSAMWPLCRWWSSITGITTLASLITSPLCMYAFIIHCIYECKNQKQLNNPCQLSIGCSPDSIFFVWYLRGGEKFWLGVSTPVLPPWVKCCKDWLLQNCPEVPGGRGGATTPQCSTGEKEKKK